MDIKNKTLIQTKIFTFTYISYRWIVVLNIKHEVMRSLDDLGCSDDFSHTAPKVGYVKENVVPTFFKPRLIYIKK